MLPGLDLLTRKWWRAVGRPVDLAGDDAWLDAPMSAGPVVRDGWLAATAAKAGGQVHEEVPGAGLIPHLSSLDGPGFDAARLSRRCATSTNTPRIGGWRCGPAGNRCSSPAAI